MTTENVSTREPPPLNELFALRKDTVAG